MKDYLRDMVARRKQGEVCGIGSYCTANELVIEACMQRALRDHQVVLVEAPRTKSISLAAIPDAPC